MSLSLSLPLLHLTKGKTCVLRQCLVAKTLDSTIIGGRRKRKYDYCASDQLLLLCRILFTPKKDDVRWFPFAYQQSMLLQSSSSGISRKL
jgi:hypothetical protein